MKNFSGHIWKKTINFPVDTQHRLIVYKTSIRRHRRRIDMLQTLKRCRVSTGLKRLRVA